tara:strand:- start:1400 stop:1579 length:180 start_codon:yes stop_codon:yes gene_type:complete
MSDCILTLKQATTELFGGSHPRQQQKTRKLIKAGVIRNFKFDAKYAIPKADILKLKGQQ